MTTNDDLDRRVIELDRRRSFILFRELQATSTKQWLVHNFLGDGEASAMYGKPGDGKSALAEDLALQVAAGWPWHGRAVKQGAVVYVALERRKLVERRAIAFREKHGLKDLPFAIVGGVHDFRDPRTAARMADIVAEVEAATETEVVLIVIDTLSRALCGGDENSPKDMGAIVNATGILHARTQAHVLWVHHMPIDGGERMRGHGALLAAMDTTIHVVKTDTIRTATVIKANDSEEGERIAFTLESVTIGEDADGNPTTAPVVVPVEGGAPRYAPKPGRLPKAAQIALRALSEALEEQGGPAPPSNHVPPGVRVVTVSAWRQQAYRRGISTSEEQRMSWVAKRVRWRPAFSSPPCLPSPAGALPRPSIGVTE
jgi:AAA domain